MFSRIASITVTRPALLQSLRRTPSVVSASRFYSSTMHDNDPEVLEKEKHRNLSKSQHHTSTPHEHAPGWNEHLASSSEASVKADRSDKVKPEDLQKHSLEYLRKRHGHEQSTEEAREGN